MPLRAVHQQLRSVRDAGNEVGGRPIPEPHGATRQHLRSRRKRPSMGTPIGTPQSEGSQVLVSHGFYKPHVAFGTLQNR